MERRAERREAREERRQDRLAAERDVAAGHAWWPHGHYMWYALVDEVSDDTASDDDYFSDDDTNF